MCGKIYTIDEIKAIASPIAESHGVAALYLFGSYARGEATSDSDLDFRIEKGRIRTIFQLGSLLCDLEDGFQKNADVLTTQMLSPEFLNSIRNEEVLLYAKVDIQERDRNVLSHILAYCNDIAVTHSEFGNSTVHHLNLPQHILRSTGEELPVPAIRMRIIMAG